MDVDRAIEAYRASDEVCAKAEAVIKRMAVGPLFDRLLSPKILAVKGPRPDYKACLTVIWEAPRSDDGSPSTFRVIAELETGEEEEVILLVRRLLLTVLAHELDEFITVDGKRVFEPHPFGKQSPFILSWTPDPMTPVLKK
jgi:hypothetical protein